MKSDIREAFEQAAKLSGRLNLQRDDSDDDRYWSAPTEHAWAGFQLAWQSQQAQGRAIKYPEHRTSPAESLAGIALRKLGDEDRWVEIRDLNAAKHPDMGPHDCYPVGTVLKLPNDGAPPAPAAVPEAGILIKIAAQLLDGRWASECVEDWPEKTGPEFAAKRAEVDQERRRKMAVSLRSFWDSLAAHAPAEPEPEAWKCYEAESGRPAIAETRDEMERYKAMGRRIVPLVSARNDH